ncbi:MAG: hypothetical protein DWQ37_10140 [Planctomycetota bacterium]|nr:MAG: hypothetical protein DWQ37_10140 [Planctomycetota bacterium]
MFCHSRFAGLLILIWLTTPAVPARADGASWVEGPHLKQQLASPTRVSWHGTPLDRALSSLSSAQHLAILRDRRVDPNQSVTLAIDGEPLEQALAAIAGHVTIGYCQFGPVAYFGPRESAGRLRTLGALRLDEASKLPRDVSRKFLLMRDWHWDRLAQPRDLLAQLAAEAEVEIVGAERIPHDLWPECNLPPLSWLDRMTLLTAQFDLTYRIDRTGKRVELVDLREPIAIERTYHGGVAARNVARRWARQLPHTKIRLEGQEIFVTARVEDHDRIEQALAGRPRRKTTVKTGPEVYQLAVENTALDKLVEQLSSRLSLTFQWDRDATESAGIAADQLVSVQVQDADLDALLEAVFADTGLAFQRDGRNVAVKPKP